MGHTVFMKEQGKPYIEDKIWNIVVDIVSAGLDGDTSKVELAALTLSRSLKRNNPEASTIINDAISNHAFAGGDVLRRMGKPLPIDNDSQLEMATVLHPDKEKVLLPILNSDIDRRVRNFLEEREGVSILLNAGIKPPNSLLLIGPPGTGKTILAKYIATALDKNLVILDLSSCISSLLGQTGSNLKKVLNYAKSTSSVLLLDEFDAIAKRRDDATDLGEIKRVVNVLLMELENWPVSSVFIATSNHPELLDRAIWRRFDHVLEIGIPDEKERSILLKNELGEFLPSEAVANKTSMLIGEFTAGKSAADICKLANNVKRRMALKKQEFIHASLTELLHDVNDKKLRGKLIGIVKERLGDAITLKDLAEITGLTIPGVQHHVTKNNQ